MRLVCSVAAAAAVRRFRRILRSGAVVVAALSIAAVAAPPAVAGEPGENPPSRRIALSFDDAPKGDGPRFSGDERALELIGALGRVAAPPAAFFVTTRNFEQPGGRKRIAAYAAAGHLIGNHSHAHNWLTRTETAEYIQDIYLADELLEGIENRRPWFRFPFLDEGRPREKRDAVRRALAARGLANGYVTIDNYDWYLDAKWQEAIAAGQAVDLDALRDVYVEMLVDAAAFYDAIALQWLHLSPVHVLLLHENDVAALFVDDLVAALRAEGWTIVSPDDAYGDPLAGIVPETLMTRQGHVAALAIEAGLDPGSLTHLAIEETQIDALLAERQVFVPADQRPTTE